MIKSECISFCGVQYQFGTKAIKEVRKWEDMIQFDHMESNDAYKKTYVYPKMISFLLRPRNLNVIGNRKKSY